jgi:uncharacterized protein YjbI with pentapeptide repeats
MKRRLKPIVSLLIILFYLLLYADCCSSMEIIYADFINNKIREGLPVNIDEKIIVGNLRPTGDPIRQAISQICITNSEIRGNLNFNKVNFSENIIISNTSIIRGVDFSYARFNKKADFSDSRFEGPANFDDCEFMCEANFPSAKFGSSATFSRTQLNEADFQNSQFRGIAIFERTTFHEKPNFGFTKFFSTTNFISAIFKDGASINNAEFERGFNFRNASLNGTRTIYFDQTVIRDTGILTGATLVGYLNLTNMNIQRIDLRNLNFAKNAIIFLKGTQFDSIILDFNLAKNYLNYDREVFSALVDNFKNQGDFIAANECYYQLRSLDKNNMNILDYFKKYSYGYGVKPLRALICCVLIVISFAVYFFSLYYQLKWEKCFDALYDSLLIFVLHQPHDLASSKRLRIAIFLEAILGWLFLSLFLASLIGSPS